MPTDARRIIVTTCRRWPEISASDALLAAELEQRGHEVRVRAWNDAPLDDFTTADAVILRSNWDYHHEFDAFEAWLDAVETAGVELHNPAPLVRAHLDKSYLVRLGSLGIDVPETLTAGAVDTDRIEAWMDRHGLDEAVVKPAWGASGHDVELIRRDSLDEALRRRHAENPRPVIAQQFVPEVANGEYALVFFGGSYSHALLRRPADDDFRVNGQYGGTMRLADSVARDLIDFGAQVIETFTVPAAYARIDVVGGAGSPITLMEIEVNEPALGLDLAPGSAARFADAVTAA